MGCGKPRQSTAIDFIIQQAQERKIRLSPSHTFLKYCEFAILLILRRLLLFVAPSLNNRSRKNTIKYLLNLHPAKLNYT